jgi:hypothetical protein
MIPVQKWYWIGFPMADWISSLIMLFIWNFYARLYRLLLPFLHGACRKGALIAYFFLVEAYNQNNMSWLPAISIKKYVTDILPYL